MRNNTTRAVLLVAAIVGLALAGTAAAATAPSVATDSDISDGATIELTNASSDTVSTLNVTTPTSENADVEVEISVADRDLTTYEADSDSSDYELVEEDNADSEDVHEWSITHDEFADVPVLANESATLNYTVTAEADDGTTENTTGQFTLDNGIQRSVIVLDEPALDGNVDGLSVSEENSSSFWNNVPTVDLSSTDYDAESDDVGINGSNTTVHVYMQDSNVADEFDSAAESGVLSGSRLGAIRGYTSNMIPFDSAANSIAPDLSPSSGDRTFEMGAVVADADGDETAIPVFYESADSDVVDTESDTHAVYDPDDSAVRVHPGSEDFGNASSMDVRTATMEPEDLVSRDAFASAMTTDLGLWGELEAFGTAEAAGLSGISLLIGIPVIGAIRTRNGAAA